MDQAHEFLDQLRRDGWIQDPDARLTPLSGGVSSDIYLVEDGPERFVVKRALARLRVKDDWFADVSRSATEEAYLRHVARWLPDAVPQLRFANPSAGYFAMEYLGAGWTNWKQLLLAGRCDVAQAGRAGFVLGTIHRRSASDTEVIRTFDTTLSFHQLRTDPYLLTTGQRHPRLRDRFFHEAARLESTRECLVHGDFSPKNILVGADRMILLDCEVAWYGDPAFDVAFLLNHLYLKSLYHAPRLLALDAVITGFWRAYRETRGNATDETLETRVAPLLLMLMLARVDGKSPAEYLNSTQQQFVRNFVCEMLPATPTRLETVSEAWFERLPSLPKALKP